MKKVDVKQVEPHDTKLGCSQYKSLKIKPLFQPLKSPLTIPDIICKLHYSNIDDMASFDPWHSYEYQQTAIIPRCKCKFVLPHAYLFYITIIQYKSDL